MPVLIGEWEREIARYKEREARVLSACRQHAWQWEVLVTVPPSVLIWGVEGGQWLLTWRLKTLLSYAVIPSHKSVLSHPLCTDKATKQRGIYTRNGERNFFSVMSGLSCPLSHSHLLSSLSVFHSSDLNSRHNFFFYLGLVCLHLAIFSLVAFPAVWLWSSEEWERWEMAFSSSL